MLQNARENVLIKIRIWLPIKDLYFLCLHFSKAFGVSTYFLDLLQSLLIQILASILVSVNIGWHSFT